MLTYKRKLILNQAQQKRIDSWMGVCRMVYNMGLEIEKEAWRNQQRYVSRYELSKQIKDIRQTYDWVEDCPFETVERHLFRLDNAFKKFFKGGGFPRFQSKKHSHSISFKQNFSIIANHYLKLPKLGAVKFFTSAEIFGEIKTVTVKKEATGYYACIMTDAIKSIQCPDENQVIGIDMGLKYFAVLSDGRFIENPKHFAKYERRLRIENRSLARKKKGGNNRKKQVRKVGLLHNKIKNLRSDFLHKQSTRIAKENHFVFVEDLNVVGMAKNKNLSKHILDSGWGAFRELLLYKTNVVAVNPKHTSQICSHCGHQDSESRKSQSEFICTSCGHAMNADHNAALNILSRGTAHVRERKAIA